MKKFTTLTLIIVAVLFTNCKKKNNQDDEQEEQTSTYVPVRILTTDANGGVTTSDYEYDTNLNITKITSTGTTHTTVKDYYYQNETKGLLDSIVTTLDGNFNQVDVYTNSNDKISQIEIYNSGRVKVQTVTVTHYDGNKPDRITISKLINGSYNDFNMSATFNGDNIVRAETTADLQGNQYSSNVNFTFDDKHEIFTNVNTKDDYQNKNNILTESYQVVYFGQTITANANCTYTYDDKDYPTHIEKVVSGTSMQGLSNYVQDITYEEK